MLTKTIALVLAMTASVFFATPAAYAQLIDISPVNAAAATNSDDDTVVQANTANIKQQADVECEAKVSDDDKVQVGYNLNAAANDCDTTQTATVAQANTNQDNDVQVAEATACQALGLIAGVNLCDNVIAPPEEPVYCLTEDVEVQEGAPRVRQIVCFETEEECEAYENAPAGDVVSDCQRFERPPPGAIFLEVPL